MRFFRPDLLRAILFAILMLIAVGGAYESAAFTDDGSGTAFGAWVVWMVLLAPLALLLLAVDAVGPKLDLFRAAPAIFWIVQAIYFYAIACVVAAIVQKLRGDAARRRPVE